MPLIDDVPLNEFVTPQFPELEKPPKEAPSFLDIMGAAGRTENDIVAAVELMSQPKQKVDMGFNLVKEAEARKVDPADFTDAVNAAHLDMLIQKRDQEVKDNQVLDESGWLGFGARMAAGLISPTTLLPMVGASGTGAKVALAVGLNAAVGAGAQEAVLFANQRTRTKENAMYSIGSSMVLGTVLGAIAHTLSKSVVDKIAHDMDHSPNAFTISNPPPGVGDAGAKEAGHLQDAGALKKGWGANALAFLSPVTRGFEQWNAPAYLKEMGGSSQLRKMTAGFSQGSLSLTENKKFLAASPGGNVEDLKRTYAAVSYAGSKILEDNYVKYILGTEPGGIFKKQRAVLSGATRPDGKLTYGEFKRQIALDMWSNFSREGVPDMVRKAAKEIDERVYKKLYDEGVEVGIFTGKEKTVGDENYANRVYNNEVIMRRHNEFVKILADHYREALDKDFNAKLTKLNEAMQKDKQAFEDMNLPFEKAAKLRDDLLMEKVDIVDATNPAVIKGVDTLKANTKAVKELTTELDNLKKIKIEGSDLEGLKKRQDRMGEIEAALKAKALESEGVRKALGTELEKYQQAASEIRRRLNNLNKNIHLQDAKMNKKLDKIAANEDAQVQTILRAQKQLQKFIKMLESASPEKLDAELSKLKDAFEAHAKKFDDLTTKLNELENGPELKLNPTKWDKAPVSEQDQVQKRIDALSAYEQAQGGYELMSQRKAADKAKLDALLKRPKGGNPYLGEVLSTYDLGQSLREKLPLKEYKKKAYEALDRKYQQVEDAWKKAQEDYKKAGSPDPGVIDELNPEFKQAEEIVKSNFWGALDQVGMYEFDGTTRSPLRQALDDYYQNYVDTMHEQFGKDNLAVWDHAENEWAKLEHWALEQEKKDPAVVPKGERAVKDSGLPPEMRLGDQIDSVAGKMDDISTRIEKLDAHDRVAFKAEIDDMMRELADTHAKINAKRVLRNEKLWKQVENLGPEARAKRMADLQLKMKDRPQKFIDRWNTRNAGKLAYNDKGLLEGQGDFTAHAEEMARETVAKILGTDRRLAFSDIIKEKRGPELARVLNIPSEKIQDFLETDIEKMLAIYTRTVGSDISIARVFGSPDAAEDFAKLSDEQQNMLAKIETMTDKEGKPLDAKTKEELQYKTNKFYDDARKDLYTLMERAKGVRGIPKDPASWSARGAKMAMDINFMRMMGNVVVSSVADPARLVMKYGLTRTFRDAFWPMITNWKTIRMSQKEAMLAGSGLDPVLHSRAYSLFDIFDDAHRGTPIEKATHWASTKMGLVAGFDHWTSAIKQVTAGAANAKLLDNISAIMEGKVKGKQLEKAQEFLARNNLDADLVERIWKEVTNGEGGGKVNGIWLPNTDSWTDAGARRAYRAALGGEIDSTIITPGFERPSWVDSSIPARMVAQFKSFGFTSTQKTLMAGLQEHDIAYFNGIMSSLALGALSYYLYGVAVGGKTYEEMMNAGPEKWADEAISRSGVTGVFDEVQRIANRVPLLQQYASFSGKQTTRRGGGSLLDETLGPSYDLLSRAFKVATEIDEPTKSTLHTVRTLLPLQNVFYLRQLIDKIEEAAGSGLPKRRAQ